MCENKYNPDYDDNKFLNTIYVGKRMNWNGRYVELITEDEQQFFVVSEKASATLYETDGGRQKIQATVLDVEGKVPVELNRYRGNSLPAKVFLNQTIFFPVSFFPTYITS